MRRCSRLPIAPAYSAGPASVLTTGLRPGGRSRSRGPCPSVTARAHQTRRAWSFTDPYTTLQRSQFLIFPRLHELASTRCVLIACLFV